MTDQLSASRYEVVTSLTVVRLDHRSSFLSSW